MCWGEELESGSGNDKEVGRSGLEKIPLEESSWFMLSCSPRLDPQLMTPDSEESHLQTSKLQAFHRHGRKQGDKDKSKQQPKKAALSLR